MGIFSSNDKGPIMGGSILGGIGNICYLGIILLAISFIITFPFKLILRLIGLPINFIPSAINPIRLLVIGVAVLYTTIYYSKRPVDDQCTKENSQGYTCVWDGPNLEFLESEFVPKAKTSPKAINRLWVSVYLDPKVELKMPDNFSDYLKSEFVRGPEYAMFWLDPEPDGKTKKFRVIEHDINTIPEPLLSMAYHTTTNPVFSKSGITRGIGYNCKVNTVVMTTVDNFKGLGYLGFSQIDGYHPKIPNKFILNGKKVLVIIIVLGVICWLGEVLDIKRPESE